MKGNSSAFKSGAARASWYEYKSPCNFLMVCTYVEGIRRAEGEGREVHNVGTS